METTVVFSVWGRRALVNWLIMGIIGATIWIIREVFLTVQVGWKATKRRYLLIRMCCCGVGVWGEYKDPKIPGTQTMGS